jgi:hypothetical protein
LPRLLRRLRRLRLLPNRSCPMLRPVLPDPGRRLVRQGGTQFLNDRRGGVKAGPSDPRAA